MQKAVSKMCSGRQEDVPGYFQNGKKDLHIMGGRRGKLQI